MVEYWDKVRIAGVPHPEQNRDGVLGQSENCRLFLTLSRTGMEYRDRVRIAGVSHPEQDRDGSSIPDSLLALWEDGSAWELLNSLSCPWSRPGSRGACRESRGRNRGDFLASGCLF